MVIWLVAEKPVPHHNFEGKNKPKPLSLFTGDEGLGAPFKPCLCGLEWESTALHA